MPLPSEDLEVCRGLWQLQKGRRGVLSSLHCCAHKPGSLAIVPTPTVVGRLGALGAGSLFPGERLCLDGNAIKAPSLPSLQLADSSVPRSSGPLFLCLGNCIAGVQVLDSGQVAEETEFLSRSKSISSSQCFCSGRACWRDVRENYAQRSFCLWLPTTSSSSSLLRPGAPQRDHQVCLV